MANPRPSSSAARILALTTLGGASLAVILVACASEPALMAPPSPPSATPPPGTTVPPPASTDACAAPSFRTALLPGCEPLLASSLRVSATAHPEQAGLAVDGSSCTSWNSGAPAPQAITLDLGTSQPVGHVVLVPSMQPDGRVSVIVEVSDDGDSFEVRARYEDRMFSGGVFGIILAPAARARFVRVRTVQSPSWVAWSEVQPVACPHEPLVPPSTGGTAGLDGSVAISDASAAETSISSSDASTSDGAAPAAPHVRILPQIASGVSTRCARDADCTLTYSGCCPPCGRGGAADAFAVSVRAQGRQLGCSMAPGTYACPACLFAGYDCSVSTRCVAGTCRVAEDEDAARAELRDPLLRGMDDCGRPR